MERGISISEFSGGESGIPPGACGLLAAAGELDVMALLHAAECLQYRARTGAGVTLKGIYGDQPFYVFHVMYRNDDKRKELESWFQQYGIHLLEKEEMVRKKFYYEYDMPRMIRYSVSPPSREEMLEVAKHDDPDRFVTERVKEFNSRFRDDARIFSSSKNMGTFLTAFELKDTIKIFELDKFCTEKVEALLIHVRWPTSAGRGLWWGPQPISLFDLSGIHNGHLSSDRANARALEALGIMMQVGTDSEAIFLEISYLLNEGYSLEEIEWIMAQKFPEEASLMERDKQERYFELTGHPVLSQFKMSGPSTAIVLDGDVMLGITDRDHLRPFAVGETSDLVILGSEERAVVSGAYLLGRDVKLHTPDAGKLVGFKIEGRKVKKLSYEWRRKVSYE